MAAVAVLAPMAAVAVLAGADCTPIYVLGITPHGNTG